MVSDVLSNVMGAIIGAGPERLSVVAVAEGDGQGPQFVANVGDVGRRETRNQARRDRRQSAMRVAGVVHVELRQTMRIVDRYVSFDVFTVAGHVSVNNSHGLTKLNVD